MNKDVEWCGLFVRLKFRLEQGPVLEFHSLKKGTVFATASNGAESIVFHWSLLLDVAF